MAAPASSANPAAPPASVVAPPSQAAPTNAPATSAAAPQPSQSSQPAAPAPGAPSSAPAAPSGASSAPAAPAVSSAPVPSPPQPQGTSSASIETPWSQPPISLTYTPGDPSAFVSDTAAHGIAAQKGFPGWAIGAIVGSIFGAIALGVLSFIIWKQCRHRGEKIPPPPPRSSEKPYVVPTYGGNRNSVNRASSYSTLLQPTNSGRNSMMYASYPVTSPGSSFTADQSPKMTPGFGQFNVNGDSPSLSSNGTGASTPAPRPALATSNQQSVQQGGSSSSDTTGEGEGEGEYISPELRNRSSDPRLHTQSSNDQIRPRTPHTNTDTSDSRTNSPHPSSIVAPGQRLPRPASTLSMQQQHSRTLLRQTSGAPHKGRDVQLSMPRPLSVSSNLDIASSNPGVAPRNNSFYGNGSNRGSYISARSGPPRSMSMYGEYSTDYAIPTSPSYPGANQRSFNHNRQFSSQSRDDLGSNYGDATHRTGHDAV